MATVQAGDDVMSERQEAYREFIRFQVHLILEWLRCEKAILCHQKGERKMRWGESNLQSCRDGGGGMVGGVRHEKDKETRISGGNGNGSLIP